MRARKMSFNCERCLENDKDCKATHMVVMGSIAGLLCEECREWYMSDEAADVMSPDEKKCMRIVKLPNLDGVPAGMAQYALRMIAASASLPK